MILGKNVSKKMFNSVSTIIYGESKDLVNNLIKNSDNYLISRSIWIKVCDSVDSPVWQTISISLIRNTSNYGTR
jgi:hypothetical protein